MSIECDAGIDTARIGELARLLGNERLGELIDVLAARLHQIMSRWQDRSGGAELAALVHQSCGSAGSLGMPQLARLLGQLEIVMSEAAIERTDRAATGASQHAQVLAAIAATICALKQARSSAMAWLGTSSHQG